MRKAFGILAITWPTAWGIFWLGYENGVDVARDPRHYSTMPIWGAVVFSIAPVVLFLLAEGIRSIVSELRARSTA